MTPRARLLVNALGVTTLLAHGGALILTDGSATSDPISQLSRGGGGWLHGIGLNALGVSWVVIAALLWRLEDRLLWRLACALLIVSAAMMPYLSWYFATATEQTLLGPGANDPLGVLASLLGVAMGALQPGIKRRSEHLARANLLILALWLALIPVIPFIEAHWLGAYERTVGLLMLIWTWTLGALPGAKPMSAVHATTKRAATD